MARQAIRCFWRTVSLAASGRLLPTCSAPSASASNASTSAEPRASMKFLYSAQSHPRAASLFALFLFLAYPLWAKCPVHFVQIRGKIECSFKPDDKVLATLIFSDDQPQTFGEETAIDIHDATFSGRVAFDTYSSSGFLSGDKCHRR